MGKGNVLSLQGRLSLPFELGENMSAGDPFYVYDDAGNAKIERVISKVGDKESFCKGAYHAECLVDANIKVVAFRNSAVSNFGTVIAGEIQADKSVIWGTPYNFYTATAYYFDICSHVSSGFCVSFRGVGNRAQIRAGSVDASQNITMGTPVSLSVSTAYYTQIISPASGKVACSFRDAGASNNLIGRAATISGNVINTPGAARTLAVGAPGYISLCSPSPDKIAYSYYLSSKGYVGIATLTDITINIPGTQSEFNNSAVYSTYIKSPSIDKIVVAYRNFGDGSKPYARCTTLTGVIVDTWGDA